jgi:hypothetical protein
MTKTYNIYERVLVKKTIGFCEECNMMTGGYDPKTGWGGCVCMYHQRPLDSERNHVPIPDWCKIDECKMTLNTR